MSCPLPFLFCRPQKPLIYFLSLDFLHSVRVCVCVCVSPKHDSLLVEFLSSVGKLFVSRRALSVVTSVGTSADSKILTF